MNKVKSLINDFPFSFISIMIVVVVASGVMGFASRVPSIEHPEKKVNYFELNAEVDAFLAKAESRYEELEEKEMFRRKVINSGIELAQKAGVDYLGMASMFGNILLGGVTIDNIRLRREKLKKS